MHKAEAVEAQYSEVELVKRNITAEKNHRLSIGHLNRLAAQHWQQSIEPSVGWVVLVGPCRRWRLELVHFQSMQPATLQFTPPFIQCCNNHFKVTFKGLSWCWSLLQINQWKTTTLTLSDWGALCSVEHGQPARVNVQFSQHYNNRVWPIDWGNIVQNKQRSERPKSLCKMAIKSQRWEFGEFVINW